jgi:hypothetical protein
MRDTFKSIDDHGNYRLPEHDGIYKLLKRIIQESYGNFTTTY